MKVWMLWHGGPNYTIPRAEDAEEFESLERAKRAFVNRADNADGHTPGVIGPVAQIFTVRPDGSNYPDRLLTLGPRGGVNDERC